MIIKLSDITKNDHPFGNSQGQEVYNALKGIIEANYGTFMFEISMDGIIATDASFPRESVIAIAKYFRKEKGIFLSNITDQDLIDNWSYAAIAKDQPLVIWNQKSYSFIGPELSKATNDLITIIYNNDSVTAAYVANELDISTPNASTRLKKLFDAGYVLRNEEIAESGGKEFIYLPIK